MISAPAHTALRRWSTIEFLHEVLAMYRKRPGVFLQLLVPALVLAFGAVYAGQDLAFRMRAGIPEGSLDIFPYAAMGFVRLGSAFLAWLLYSFAFAGVALAVERLHAGEEVSAEECLGRAREHPGRLMAVASSLFAIFAAAQVLLIWGLVWLLGTLPQHWVLMTQFVAVAQVALMVVMSRFALAIPAVVLDGCRFGECYFRSDEYTERRWSALIGLLVESVVGGSLAWLAPYYIAEWLGVSISERWQEWVLFGIGMTGAALVQPPMFIGFSWLYIRERESHRQARELATQIGG
jgi:hypothetical protein